MKVRQYAIVFEQCAHASIVSNYVQLTLPPYGVLLKSRSTIVSAGTELNMLFEPSISIVNNNYPVIPRAFLVAEIINVGAAVQKLRPELHVGARIFIKGKNVLYFCCDVLRDELFVVPDAISDEHMLLARQAIVGINALKVAKAKIGTSVHIIGMGVIGQLLARLAVITKCNPVVVSDHHEMRLRLASSIPMISTYQQGYFEIVFLACGSLSAFEEGFRTVDEGGSLVMMGAVKEEILLDCTKHIFRRNVQLLGAHEKWLHRTMPKENTLADLLELIISLILNGILDLDGIITDRFSPINPQKIYHTIYHDKEAVLGVIIDWRKIAE
jgi:bacteriochlorophyllide a dehydrogenase